MKTFKVLLFQPHFKNKPRSIVFLLFTLRLFKPTELGTQFHKKGDQIGVMDL